MGEHYEMEVIWNEWIRGKKDIETLKKLLEKQMGKEIQVIVERWTTKEGEMK